MEFGIYDINVSNGLNYKERLDIYKKSGFKSVGLYIDEKYMENGENYEDIISYAKNIGLKINQVHVCYKLSNDICDNSKNYISYMNDKLQVCEKHGIKNMVLHASKGDNPPEINDAQIKMIETLANSHKSVNLAFENVRNNTNLEKILTSKIKNITFCFDLGHANAYNSFGLLDKFAGKITCSHLHSNHGADTHELLSFGEIDYKPVINKLKSLNADLCLEVFPARGTFFSQAEFEKFIKQAFDDLNF